MKLLKHSIPVLFISIVVAGCVNHKGMKKSRIQSRIPVKQIEAGTCVFGAKTLKKAVITTRSDCVLRGGAFSLDN